MSAHKLCGDEGLSQEAAKAVEYLAGSRDFDRDQDRLSPESAAESLVQSYQPGDPTDDLKKARACVINLHDGDWGAMTAGLAIVPKDDPRKASGGNAGTYRLGDNLGYSYPGGADLYFNCVSAQLADSSHDHPLVRAELVVAPSLWHLAGHKKTDVQKAQLILINAIAFTASKELGCTDYGGLRQTTKPRLVAQHQTSSPSTALATD
ncbi:hypothetical protein [Streptomyces montanisoli]|uniref:Uncharacterized protein n=1 Tax=Streptomyces montanisoli TaxID=2798581 RepID=A0A940RXY0_9ACTN|nr:hypothetical protein [Streptomyces montanisoli]MBP0458603.1 hypothetical protein [Streptomyces montanisoli]